MSRLGSWLLRGWLAVALVLGLAPCCEGVTTTFGASVVVQEHADDVADRDHGDASSLQQSACEQSISAAPFVPSVVLPPPVDTSTAFLPASDTSAVAVEDPFAAISLQWSDHGPPRDVPAYLIYSRLLL